MSDNKKCSVCEKSNAKIILKLNENINCAYCGYLKYKINKEKMNLCKLNCSNLYWIPENYNYDESANKFTVTFMIEKDDCIKCGKRGLHSAEYIGFIMQHDYCQFCNKNARYELQLEHHIHCYDCHKIKYPQKSTKLMLCSTRCDKLSWKPVEYLTKKNNDNTKLIYRIQNDPCKKCSQINDSIGIFSGTRSDF